MFANPQFVALTTVFLQGTLGLVAAMQSSPEVPVLSVHQAPVGDLVLLGGGLHQGLRTGMILEIKGNETPNRTCLVLIDVQPTCAIALITELHSSIKNGDLATLRVSSPVQSNL